MRTTSFVLVNSIEWFWTEWKYVDPPPRTDGCWQSQLKLAMTFESESEAEEAITFYQLEEDGAKIMEIGRVD